jgi:transposase
VREVMNGVLYVPETGCQWRALPKDLPPKSTVHDYLMLWDAAWRIELVKRCAQAKGFEVIPRRWVTPSSIGHGI